MTRFNDPDQGWPQLETADFMNVLDDIAEKTFAKNTIEGHLAALLIWHQLCEEMAKLLLKETQFLIQLSVYPAEIEFPEKKKQPMFGQIIDDLSKTISFERKEEFLNACRKLNTQRIRVVHRLTQHTSLSEVMARVGGVKSMYDQIFRIYEDAHDAFRVNFNSLAKDHIEFMEEELKIPKLIRTATRGKAAKPKVSSSARR